MLEAITLLLSLLNPPAQVVRSEPSQLMQSEPRPVLVQHI